MPFLIAVTIVIGVMSARVVLKNYRQSNSMNAQSAIGKEYTLLKSIGFNKPGEIKIKDVIWNVVAETQEEEIEAGVIVKIIALRGNKYVVKKV